MCTVYSVQWVGCIMLDVQLIPVYRVCVQCTVYSVQCIVLDVQCTVKMFEGQSWQGTKCKLYFLSGIATVHGRIQSSLRLESFRPNFLEAIQVWIKKVAICNSLDPVESQYLDSIFMTYLRPIWTPKLQQMLLIPNMLQYNQTLGNWVSVWF